jgi:error-prone DNA polymerase
LLEVGALLPGSGCLMFTHLHVASAYSAHYGVTRPEFLVEAALSQGASALAITDRGGLYGAVRHIGACMQVGLSPIVGVELEYDGGHVVVLAHGGNGGLGWKSLCRLVSAYQKGKWSLVGLRDCTVLLGTDLPFAQAAMRGDRASAMSLLRSLNESLIGVSVAIEVVSHLTEPGTLNSSVHAKRLVELADAVGLPAVLTNSVRYVTPDDALTADVLDSARFLLPLGSFGLQPNAQAWLKDAALMQRLAIEICGDSTRAKRLLDATTLLASRCVLSPVTDCGWGKPKTPEKETLGISGDPFSVLQAQVEAGLDWRYPGISGRKLLDVRHRLNKEMMTIHQLGFSTYFLTVADVAQMIRDMKIRIAARGSGAGSLVNYLLGISGVDPIEHDLLFERFLSTERSSLPDIDIDVESARRHDIYRAIFKRYGSSRVTLLSMQNTYRARGAVRDSGLALGYDDDEIDELAKNIWRFSAGSFRAAASVKPELAAVAQALATDRKMNLLVDITERLNRLPRHISMHPCGVILGDASLLDLTPVEPSGLGLPMSQFDKDDMDPMGFLKLDVLGVRMQSAMAYAVRELDRVSGVSLDLDAVPLDDPATFRDIRTTNTLGIFQIESPGQRELTGKHQPTVFNDLTIQISLFRPGPMKGNMIAPYLDGRHGFAKPKYLHPDLEPILSETFGVVIFHEHVLRIFNKMTGCTLARADEMRRSLEDPRKKSSIEEFFRTKASANGYSEAVVSAVWATLEGFSSFGFCKAHGAAFAMPTYQSAWLKTHYPVEFMAGLFTHDPGMYPRRLLLAEARRLGVAILPLDVNKSLDEYRVEKTPSGKAVRLALTELVGISTTEIARIMAGAPYSSIGDFYLRAQPSRKTFEHLALVGALDTLAPITSTRGDIVAEVKQYNGIKKRSRETSQPMLDFAEFGAMPKGNAEMPKSERIQTELRLMKLDVSGHVLEMYQPMLDAMGVVTAAELVGLRSKSEVLVAGVRVATQTPPMRSGKRVVFISLDDGTGCSDATFFDEAQARCSAVLFNTRLVLIAGKTRRTGVRGVSIEASNAWDLKELWNQWQKEQRQSA